MGKIDFTTEARRTRRNPLIVISRRLRTRGDGWPVQQTESGCPVLARFWLGRGFSCVHVTDTLPTLRYIFPMPSGLRRYQQSRGLHFLTFSCYRRLPFLVSPRARDRFERALEQARVRYGFYVAGYVVMPEHIHLLLTEPERGNLASAVQAIKQSVSRKLIARPRPLLAGSLLRLQCVHGEEAHREAEVHTSKSGEARTGGSARRLGLE